MKKVLITGTGRGIGWATAEKFLNEGYFVVGTSTSGQSMIKRQNYECYQLQLESEISIDSSAEQIFSKHPQFDLFISNAGFADAENTGLDLSILRKTLEVNVIGTIAFAQKAIKAVSNGGRAIFLGSIMGSVTRADEFNYPSYRISKAGLHMYSKLLSLDVADRNIQVITLHPGWVKTDSGGPDAPKTAEKAAQELYNLAIQKDLETGTFWNETVAEAW
jgi:NAD(P)-dependent dehydrogenase (short-subunit alcohol dehydrogenase family)